MNSIINHFFCSSKCSSWGFCGGDVSHMLQLGAHGISGPIVGECSEMTGDEHALLLLFMKEKAPPSPSTEPGIQTKGVLILPWHIKIRLKVVF